MQGVSEQFKVFLYSFGMGALLGVLYDAFRILRLIIPFGKIATFIQDFLYVLICAFTTFFFVLVMNEGKIMFYILLGEALGWIIYYFSLGSLTMRLSKAIVNGVKKFSAAVFSTITRPIKFMIRKIKRLVSAFSSNTKAKSKKVAKNAKLHLKKGSGMMYTLNRIIYSSGTKSDDLKRKNNVGKKRKKEEDV